MNFTVKLIEGVPNELEVDTMDVDLSDASVVKFVDGYHSVVAIVPVAQLAWVMRREGEPRGKMVVSRSDTGELRVKREHA